MLKDELLKLFPDTATAEPEELTKHATDASIFEVQPEVVVYPREVGDLKALVRFARERQKDFPKLSLTARAAGTCMSGGSLNESVIVNFTKYLNRVGAVAGDTITVQPGAHYRDLEKVTLASDLLLPSYPASKDICAVGGMVANNAAGERTLAYGSTERFVERLRVVLADGEEYELGKLATEQLTAKLNQPNFEGEIYRAVKRLLDRKRELITRAKPKVSKNSSGYLLWNIEPEPGGPFDLAQLFVGAQGTLGLMSEITFRLVRNLPVRRMLVITLDDLGPLPIVVARILARQPESFECYDHHTFRLAQRYLIEPSRGVITKPETKLTLLAEFAGEEEVAVAAAASAAQAALSDLGLQTTLPEAEASAANYWRIRRASFALLREHNESGHRVAPFIDDVIVPPERLAEFLPRFNEILDRHGLVYTIAGHIGNGNFHLIPLVDLEREEKRADLLRVAAEVFQLTFSCGGSMAGEHNDGIIRTPFLPAMYGEEVCDLFAEVKQIFDPQNIFNPGKKVGGSLDYTLGHISHSNHSPHF